MIKCGGSKGLVMAKRFSNQITKTYFISSFLWDKFQLSQICLQCGLWIIQCNNDYVLLFLALKCFKYNKNKFHPPQLQRGNKSDYFKNWVPDPN